MEKRFNHLRRVHISDKTLAYLSGEFEVEPAYGEKREEALRIAGLKTYFIKKVLKPVSVMVLLVNRRNILHYLNIHSTYTYTHT